jgi:hypothetical protein
MMTLLRWVLLVVIGLLLVGLVVRGVGTTDTGAAEKLALLVAGAVLLFAASRVHRIGRGAAN